MRRVDHASARALFRAGAVAFGPLAGVLAAGDRIEQQQGRQVRRVAGAHFSRPGRAAGRLVPRGAHNGWLAGSAHVSLAPAA